MVRSSPTWAPDELPYFVSSNRWRRIPSPNSTMATFGKVLCGHCNSTRTQPFDLAYETFSAWVNHVGEGIMTIPELDFTAIYGDDYKNSVLNLCKYFVKHLGCLLASDGYYIPPDLAPSLWMDDLAPFEISFARSSVLGNLPARGPGVLGNFPLIGSYSISSGTVRAPYITGTIVGYLDVIIRYGFVHRYPWEGDPICHRNSRVRLGLYNGAVTGTHLIDGHLPDSGTSRRFCIGDVNLTLPILSPEHIQDVLSLAWPKEGMKFEENVERKLAIIHAILSPFWPGLTIQYLAEHLSIPDMDALWRVAVSP